MDAGLIDINKLFSTFGFIGLWEAYNFLSEKKGKYEDLAVDIIKFYKNIWFSKRYKYIFI